MKLFYVTVYGKTSLITDKVYAETMTTFEGSYHFVSERRRIAIYPVRNVLKIEIDYDAR